MDNVFGERFYGHREAGWHKKGIVTQQNMKAVETFSAVSGVWLEERPVTVFLNGENRETGDKVIIRSATPDDPTERIFGYLTQKYHVIQPLRVCEIFDEKVGQSVETLGFLGQGEKMFLTWKLEPFDVGKDGDRVNPFGFVAIGFDGKYSASLNVVFIRVVCENTWRLAIYEAEKNKTAGQGRIWSGKHTSPNLEKELGIWMGFVEQRSQERYRETNAILNVMADTPIKTNSEVDDLIAQIFPYPSAMPEFFPDELKAKRQEKIDAEMTFANKNRDGVKALFDGEGTAIDATAWGLFNAVTEWENYGLDSKKDTGYSVLFGGRDKAMNKAYNVLVDAYVK